MYAILHAHNGRTTPVAIFVNKYDAERCRHELSAMHWRSPSYFVEEVYDTKADNLLYDVFVRLARLG